MECHAYGHDTWQEHYVKFFDVSLNMLNNVEDVTPHSVQVVHLYQIVTRMFSCLTFMYYENINSMDPHIQFTTEKTRPDGSMPFLDTLVKPEQNWTMSITVYSKPTHTDQYLQWDSHHNFSAK